MKEPGARLHANSSELRYRNPACRPGHRVLTRRPAGQEHADAATGPDAGWQPPWSGDDTLPGPPRNTCSVATLPPEPEIEEHARSAGTRALAITRDDDGV
jgi:hypothetical protein